MGHAVLTKAPAKGKTAKSAKAPAKGFPVVGAKKARANSHGAQAAKPAARVRKLTRAQQAVLAGHADDERVGAVVAQVLQRKPEVNEALVAMLLGESDDVLPL